MTNKMQDAGFSVVVNVVYLDEDTFQRQRDVEGLSYGKPIWFISEQTNEKEAWVWVKDKKNLMHLKLSIKQIFILLQPP